MNARATISKNGQITIPKLVRESHGWDDGTELEFVDDGGGVTIRPVAGHLERRKEISFEGFLARRIKLHRPFPTDEEIDAALIEEAGRRYDDSRR